MVKFLEVLGYDVGHGFESPICQPVIENVCQIFRMGTFLNRRNARKIDIGSAFQMLFPRYSGPQTPTDVRELWPSHVFIPLATTRSKTYMHSLCYIYFLQFIHHILFNISANQSLYQESFSFNVT